MRRTSFRHWSMISSARIRDTIAQELVRIQNTAKALAKLDVYASLSLVSERNHYVRPKLNEKGVIDIKDGRHPVVEQMITNDMFIANDTYLDNGSPPYQHHYRSEYGGKIHIYASDGTDRADGTDRLFRAGQKCQHRHCRPDLYPCGCIG